MTLTFAVTFEGVESDLAQCIIEGDYGNAGTFDQSIHGHNGARTTTGK